MDNEVYQNGYEFKTTFWRDFTIADAYGIEAVEDTFKRAFKEWKDNYIYLTELVLVLNWKIWQHWEKNGYCDIAETYNRLWIEAQNYGYATLKGDELDYFIRTLD